MLYFSLNLEEAMSSPDRVELRAAAVARLVEAMRLMEANQEERDQILREHEARIRENQTRIREILAVLTEMQLDIARLDASSS